VLGVEKTEGSSDREAPVTSLGDILVVSELEHQLVKGFGVLDVSKTPLLDTLTEAEVREGGGYDVERRSIGCGQERKDG
jgi:hypothetical protein